MNKLNEFYKSRLRGLAFLLGFICVTLLGSFNDWVTITIPQYTTLDSSLKMVIDGVIFAVFLGIPFTLGESFIRTRLWKFFHPELNFSGTWFGVTHYTHVEVDSAKVKAKNFTPFPSAHKVTIKQDCTAISIQPSGGKDFVNWGSIAMTLTDEGVLKFAYWVNYQLKNRREGIPDNPIFPSVAVRGYEEMRTLSESRIPSLLTGSFTHCADGQEPVYRGETLFLRPEYLTKIDKASLPEFAHAAFDTWLSEQQTSK